ncbi:MAG: MCP four helix bundle domain-containing protein, partial [Desulfotignum sp.]|nr:MCP four helix bundle domain-containing protein [Desulfotignum sp.]
MTVFKEMTLGKRIAFGIALMLVLMLVVGGAGYYGLSRVDAVQTNMVHARIDADMTALVQHLAG